MRGLPKRDCGDYSVGAHLFPFRTEKLSPTAPMVLPNRWESRSSPNTTALQMILEGFFVLNPSPVGANNYSLQDLNILFYQHIILISIIFINLHLFKIKI